MQRQQRLTKPPGSLGRLEEQAITLAGLQGNVKPSLEPTEIVVFAADHGITEEGVSAYPQQVTAQMLANFIGGGAAISVMAAQLGARLTVVDVGVKYAEDVVEGVTNARVARGTANFAKQPAMDARQLVAALSVGRDQILHCRRRGARLFIGGEMGIGNTTSASAVSCALLGLSASKLTGAGTGLDASRIQHKAAVIDAAVQHHALAADDPATILQTLGGLELAALAGAYISAAQQGVASLVDGFITTAAALLAVRINPSIRPWLLFSHLSAEPGHGYLLEALQARPLLSLEMRLGEGSGAASALALLKLAVATHNDMATFEEAGLSGKA